MPRLWVWASSARASLLFSFLAIYTCACADIKLLPALHNSSVPFMTVLPFDASGCTNTIRKHCIYSPSRRSWVLAVRTGRPLASPPFCSQLFDSSHTPGDTQACSRPLLAHSYESITGSLAANAAGCGQCCQRATLQACEATTCVRCAAGWEKQLFEALPSIKLQVAQHTLEGVRQFPSAHSALTAAREGAAGQSPCQASHSICLRPCE
jgi:hypothetical protein